MRITLLNLKHTFSPLISSLIIILSISTAAQAKSAIGQQLTYEQLAEMLGWTSSTENVCQGNFIEPNLYYEIEQQQESNKLPVSIKAEETELSAHENLLFFGNVDITQPNRQITANKVILERDPETKRLQLAHLTGDVHWREPGKLIIADHADVNIFDHSGELYDVVYRLTFGTFIEPKSTMEHGLATVKIDELSSWGIAESIKRNQIGIIDITQGTYSSCPPNDPSWLIKAKFIHLDKISGRGTAKNATLYIHDTPVFYAPYFNFPIDKRRQTGFLFPSGGHSSNSGLLFSWPFYWNIAPNYDFLFSPQYMSERGIQYNGEFRYLTTHDEGNIHGSYLHDDRKFEEFKENQLENFPVGFPSRSRLANDSDNRYFLSWLHTENFNEHWSSYWYYNRVSDDYYFTDFTDDPAQITENQLINEAKIRYLGEHWAFLGHVLGYQTLHPIDQAPVNNQYIKLPEFILNGQFADFHEHMQITLNNSWVNFDKHKNPGELFEPVTGNRLNINPGVNFPFFWLSGYFNPQVQFAATQYQLNHQLFDSHEDITRTLPIFNIDSGLYFIRELNFGSSDYQQTLEPRLFYLFVPYVNQMDIPIFDTGVQPFSYEQLFRTNRFNGIDRIGDANQISYAVTTRLLQSDTGQERFRASIGQIAYFQNRRVGIIEPLADPTTLVNSVPPKQNFSPIAGRFEYHLRTNWWLKSDFAWDPYSSFTNNGNLAIHYQTDDQHIVNLGYNYLRGGDQQNLENPFSSENDLNQIDLSTVWPISEHITGFSRWYYNIGHGSWQEMFAGIEYDTCCWALRLVASRELRKLEYDDTLTSPDPRYNNKFYLEFALKTLGNIGPNSPSGLLKNGITGYKDTFGQTK